MTQRTMFDAWNQQATTRKVSEQSRAAYDRETAAQQRGRVWHSGRQQNDSGFDQGRRGDWGVMRQKLIVYVDCDTPLETMAEIRRAKKGEWYWDSMWRRAIRAQRDHGRDVRESLIVTPKKGEWYWDALVTPKVQVNRSETMWRIDRIYPSKIKAGCISVDFFNEDEPCHFRLVTKHYDSEEDARVNIPIDQRLLDEESAARREVKPACERLIDEFCLSKAKADVSC